MLPGDRGTGPPATVPSDCQRQTYPLPPHRTTGPGALMQDQTWQACVYDALKTARVSIAGYVPDAGHAHLIQAAHADPDMRAVVRTTEEEGIALAAEPGTGGKRAVLL